MTTFIAIGLTIGVLYMLGYRLDLQTQSIEQGGLIRFESSPGGARVFVDGERVSGTTSNRLSAGAGVHTVVKTRSGYHDWQKSVTLEPGKILWLNYSLLIPEQLNIQPAKIYQDVDQTLSAFERNQMFVLSNQNEPVIEELELGAAIDSQLIDFTDSVSDNAEFDDADYIMRSLDADERRIIVERRGDNSSEWYVVDTTNPTNTVEVSSILARDRPLNQVEFNYQNDQELYVRTAGQLLRVNVSARTVSQPIASQVDEFWQSKDGVVTFVQRPDSADSQVRSLQYYTNGSNSAREIRKVRSQNGSNPRVLIGEYAHRQYLAIQNGRELTVERLTLHSSESEEPLNISRTARKVLNDTGNSLSFSPNDRFLMVESTESFVTYDIELDLFTNTNLRGNEESSQPLWWIDSHHLWTNRGDTGRIYEFDGENSHALVEDAAKFSPKLTADKRFLYAWQQIEDGFELVRISLRTN